MFFKQLKRETLSEGRCNKKRKVDAAEEVAVDDDLAVTPVDICSSALFAGIGDSAGESASTSVAMKWLLYSLLSLFLTKMQPLVPPYLPR